MTNLWEKLREGERPSEAQLFLEFKYAEIKDLLKHFLTLISASLVFSVAFADKIVAFHGNGPWQAKALTIVSWFVLILALGACGIGIYTLYLASERAIHSVMGDKSNDFSRMVGHSYFYQDVAGFLYGLGLVLLVASATTNYVTQHFAASVPVP